MAIVIQHFLALMLLWAPPSRHIDGEGIAAAEQRYREIVTAAASVAFDPQEKPVFIGPHGRQRTLALMLSVAYFESGFRRDVDIGEGKFARGGGMDSCLVQIRVGAGRTPEGWDHRDLVEDRTKCFRAGLRIMRSSFATCRSSPVPDRLAIFTSGACDRGLAQSRARVGLAMRSALAPVTDAEVLGEKGSGS